MPDDAYTCIKEQSLVLPFRTNIDFIANCTIENYSRWNSNQIHSIRCHFKGVVCEMSAIFSCLGVLMVPNKIQFSRINNTCLNLFQHFPFLWSSRFKFMVYRACMNSITLWWRHNGRYSVSNHQPHDCLLKRLFRRNHETYMKYIPTRQLDNISFKVFMN